MYFQIINIECQVDKMEHFLHNLSFEFNRRPSCVWNLCAVFRERAMPKSSTHCWFCCFKNGNIEPKGGSHTGRSNEFGEKWFNEHFHENPSQTTSELAEKMDCKKKKKLWTIDQLEYQPVKIPIFCSAVGGTSPYTEQITRAVSVGLTYRLNVKRKNGVVENDLKIDKTQQN